MKDPVERMEQHTTIEKIFANHIPDTQYTFQIYKKTHKI